MQDVNYNCIAQIIIFVFKEYLNCTYFVHIFQSKLGHYASMSTLQENVEQKTLKGDGPCPHREQFRELNNGTKINSMHD